MISSTLLPDEFGPLNCCASDTKQSTTKMSMHACAGHRAFISFMRVLLQRLDVVQKLPL
jgi:hypothetical protein